MVGALQIRAPEVSLGTEYDPCRADIWSCGVVLFLILYGGYYTYDPKKDDEANNWRRQVPKVGAAAVSPACAALLDRMLCPRPAERISTDEAMQVPWVQYHAPPGWPLPGVPGPVAGMQSEEEVLSLLAEARAPARAPPGA